jgi:citrate synthase
MYKINVKTLQTPMSAWLSMSDACHLLGVQPQTIYAYVSRGKVEAVSDPNDSRKSLYRSDDVKGLAKRKQAGRKYETLATNTLFGAEPSIPTSISTFIRGRLYYRGQDAISLSTSASLEEVAKLLWSCNGSIDLTCRDHLSFERPGRASAFRVLAEMAANGHSTHGRLIPALHEEAQVLVGQLASAFGAKQDSQQALHLRFAKGWRQTNDFAELLRTAIVLLADHELTSSAFSARIAASAGASLPSCLLAGLATLSGPLHGDASGRVHSLFEEVVRLGEDRVVDHYLSSALPIAGFGHHLYPDGDPRARVLLEMFEPTKAISRFIHKVTSLTGLKPNIDIALAALVERYRLPKDAAFGVFATARSVGLIAHCIEQLEIRQVIRPRGRYVGQIPSMDKLSQNVS